MEGQIDNQDEANALDFFYKPHRLTTVSSYIGVLIGSIPSLPYSARLLKRFGPRVTSELSVSNDCYRMDGRTLLQR